MKLLGSNMQFRGEPYENLMKTAPAPKEFGLSESPVVAPNCLSHMRTHGHNLNLSNGIRGKTAKGPYFLKQEVGALRSLILED